MDSTKNAELHETAPSSTSVTRSEVSKTKSSVVQSPKSSKSDESKPKKGWFAKILLLVLTLAAVVIGVTVGLLLRKVQPSQEIIRLIAFPGVIFMNMLKMMVLPLVITSLITGLAQISGGNMGRLIGITFSLYAFTTIIAVITGIAVVTIVHPGDASYNGKMTGEHHHLENPSTPLDTVMDMIRNLFPPNLFEAFLKQAQTKYVYKNVTKLTNNGTLNSTVIEKEHKIVYRDGSNILGLITLCMAVGICLSKMGKEKNRIVVEFLTVLDEVVTVLVRMIMWYSPIGIISFIIEKILEIEDLWGVLIMLSKFIGSVAVGLAIHSLITLPLVYFLLTRKNPFLVITGMAPAWIMGFAACSSGAAMPSSIICVEENLKVSKMISRFVIPIGITVNMNGTALYEAVAAIFIAQLSGMQMTIGEVLTVSLTATLAGMATAAVPHAGLVTLIMVLSSIGLPADQVQLVFTVDWIVGRLRTIVNVVGDGFVAGIIWNYIEKREKQQRAQETKVTESDCCIQSASGEICEP